jgi:hypothetical protein
MRRACRRVQLAPRLLAALSLALSAWLAQPAVAPSCCADLSVVSIVVHNP